MTPDPDLVKEAREAATFYTCRYTADERLPSLEEMTRREADEQASLLTRLADSLEALEADYHRRGVKIIEMTEWAGAHLCRAERAEAEVLEASAKMKLPPADWLREKVATDPDCDTEAYGATPPLEASARPEGGEAPMDRHPQCRKNGSPFCPQCGYRRCLAEAAPPPEPGGDVREAAEAVVAEYMRDDQCDRLKLCDAIEQLAEVLALPSISKRQRGYEAPGAGEIEAACIGLTDRWADDHLRERGAEIARWHEFDEADKASYRSAMRGAFSAIARLEGHEAEAAVKREGEKDG